MRSEFPFKSIGEVVDTSINEIKGRKLGLVSKGLRTGWNYFNEIIGGGLQKSYNYLIAGLSGSGKSTLANKLETDVFDNNPDEDIIVLNFNFETPSEMNLIKKYSADVGMSVNDILSTKDTLSDEMFNNIVQRAQRYKDYPIYYFDVSGTADDIEDTILSTRAKHPDKWIVAIVDHTALVTPKSGQNELQLVTDLATMSIRVKKQTKCTFVFLGQLNSNIEQVDRLMNPAMHAPMRSDLFGGKSVYNAMDCIVMPHRPQLLGLSGYTLDNLPVEDRMYFHIRKQRYGELKTIVMDCSKIGLNQIEEIEVL
jgi:replicative DNA helicase